MGQKQSKVTFRYVYPADLRDLYINGAYGGVSPRHEIHAHFYSERTPIPKTVTHELTEAMTLGKEESKEIGGDLVRLIQTSIVMDLETAVRIRKWLDDKIQFLEKLKSEDKTHGKKPAGKK